MWMKIKNFAVARWRALTLIFAMLASAVTTQLTLGGEIPLLWGQYGGSYYTADAYDQFTIGQTLDLWGLTTAFGYGERQNLSAYTSEGQSLLETWEEGVMGTKDGVPYFCLEAKEPYDQSVAATVYDGADYLGMEEILECALACRYMEDHISELNNNKTDLYFLQQCVIWTIREKYDYHAFSGKAATFTAGELESHSGDVSFANQFIQAAMEWAAANKDRYEGYCKVLDNHKSQKCAVFKAIEKPTGILQLQKSSSNASLTDGNAAYSLEGAVYTLYKPGTDTVVGTLTTDANGQASLEKILPGTYDLKETVAPKGYFPDEEIHSVTIREGETTVCQVQERPKTSRGDLSFVKMDGESGSPMGGIPFEIYAITANERHVLVSREDGLVSTAASVNPHTRNTNAGSSSTDGIWFGEAEPDDRLGALPLDFYIVRELPCEKNYGKDLAYFRLVVSEDGGMVSLGEVENLSIKMTTKASYSLKNQVVTDQLSYENLTEGREYTLKAYLRDPDTGEVIQQEGQARMITTSFTPTASAGSLTVTLPLTAEGMAGRRIVVTEELYWEETKLAEHSDLTDEDQTITVPEGELTITKTIREEDILWAHGDPIFQVRIRGISAMGQRLVFYHTFHFTKEETDKMREEGKSYSLSYTFRNLPVPYLYEVQELEVSRYSLVEMKSEDSNVELYLSEEGGGYDSKAWVNLADTSACAEICLVNEKTNYQGLSHTAAVINVM